MKKTLFLLLIISLLFPIPSFGQKKGASSLSMILITVDTLRADRLGCYGYRRIKTPHMDALAREGVLFEKAFTPVPTTLPAHGSLFMGNYPTTTGLKSNGTFALEESAITLAELLKGKGYTTAAFISSYVLDSRFGLDQGFDVYDDDLVTGVKDQSLMHKERRAETVTHAALQWLSKEKKDPFFLWIHYYDPHTAYDPPQPYKDVYTHCLYDGEIAYTDSWIGVLIKKLKEMKLYDHTLLVLTGDHGEALGDHGEDTHGIFLYDATLHVPLIFRHPGLLPQNKRIGSLVRLIDIAPTLLDFSGQKIPNIMQGVSLRPLISGRMKEVQLVLFCETDYPRYTYGWSPLEGIRSEQWKYIKAPESELYNILKDPHEGKNLIPEEKKQAEQIQKEFSLIRKQISPKKATASSRTIDLDQTSREKLRSLGYVFSTSSPKDRSSYPDPKSKIGVLKHFNQGAEYLSQKKYPEAIKEFEKAIQKDPKNIDAYNCLGAVYQIMGEIDKALESYQKTISLGPDHLGALLQLGTLYLQAGKAEEGKATLEKALRVNPESPEPYLHLGIYSIGKEDWTIAKAHFQKVLELDPKNLTAQNHLASVYHKLGESDKALAICQAVLSSHPKDPSALYNFGCISMDQRKYSEALEAFQKLIDTYPDYSKAYQYMGMIHFYQNSLDKAIASFQRASAKDPKWADPHLNLGIIFAQHKGDYSRALEEFKKVVEIDSQNTLGRQLLEQTQRTIDRMKSQQGK